MSRLEEIENTSERYDDIKEKVKIFWDNGGFMQSAMGNPEMPADYISLGIFLLASITNMMEDLKLTPEEASDNGHFLVAGSSIIAKVIDEAVKYEKVSA